MDSMNDIGVVAGPAPGQTAHTHRRRGLAVTGFIATLAVAARAEIRQMSAQEVPRRAVTTQGWGL
jgi:hypothetical protein